MKFAISSFNNSIKNAFFESTERTRMSSVVEKKLNFLPPAASTNPSCLEESV